MKLSIDFTIEKDSRQLVLTDLRRVITSLCDLEDHILDELVNDMEKNDDWGMSGHFGKDCVIDYEIELGEDYE